MTTQILLIILGALVSFGFGMLAFIIQRIEKQREHRDELRDMNMLYLINCQNATLSLTEAVAIAFKSGKCNGEIDAARAKAERVRAEYSDFLTKQGVTNLH
jgi:transcription initiation factor IIE alpha subunit